ncbi:right-handed parallel beta-helix repeat-containing protein [Methanobrevibacter sp.]|uniref:right-handed parallel beta-helix repeat-containing protein n=1 Tax=Methanobrevibacter sp. TaxID=66852 RepID=UPI002E788EB3|nr:NosD domain-containing protein [Methanobrevibacter sp.]MEE1335325.1 NosD domain-containing protein [Methanobrevibacter sp.]
MDKKSLILTILLVLIVFLATNAISAEDTSNIDNNASDILELSEDNNIAAGKEVTIETTDNNNHIQEKINSLEDGDTLNFQKGDYHDICIYINKSVTINGNGATLYGYDNPSNDNIPDIIMNKTTEGGYAITNKATLYILKTNNLVLNDINFVAGANSGTATPTGTDDPKYTNCVIYNYFSNHTTISNITIDGCSWGIWFQNCDDGTIENNTIRNQFITGILNFQSKRTMIRNNTIINAKNHGIDVRHGVGPNVKVLNNTVIGSKEGIYLLHSPKHVVTGNTIINCTVSSITCCGASHITIKDNKLYNSRIGILLGGGAPQGGAYTGYNNITIGTNEWKIDELPFPPSFQYYVAEAKADYASMDSMMGTHTDSSLSNVTYVEYSEIPIPGPIIIDYDTILKPTGDEVLITSGMTNEEIQNKINNMKDGDTLIFEKNAIFENISIYIEKNIKVIGNNATLISYESSSLDLVPERIKNKTNEGGFGVSYSAVLYCMNASNIVVSNLNIECRYPGYDTTTIGTNQNLREYCTAGIYSILSPNLTITQCNINGASWGMFIGERQQGRPNAIITNNKVSNQYTTGILCFGCKNSIIANNTVANAYNHGIDVRFNQGSGVTVYNNSVSGSKEGIYLLHSSGHKVYGNTISNSKISSITCYGSGNEYIFDNTFIKSRIAIILGGGYYNVTIGKNTFKPDKLPFPPTFEHYLVKSENKYYDKIGAKVVGTYSDSKNVNLTAIDVATGYKRGTLEISLKDITGKAIANKAGTVTIDGNVEDFTTDENGTASISLALTAGNYTAKVHTVSDYYNKAGDIETLITVNDDRTTPAFTAPAKTFYLQTIEKGSAYQVTLKAGTTPVVGKEITINFNGATYKATTNDKGVATFTLKATKTGSLKATVNFAGDDEYKASSATATIKITKEASKITAKKKTFKVKKSKKYTVTLKSKSGKAINKVKVTLKVKGKKYTATTKNGKAKFNLKKLTKKGKHQATITFAGNKYFNKTTVKVKLTVKR